MVIDSAEMKSSRSIRTMDSIRAYTQPRHQLQNKHGWSYKTLLFYVHKSVAFSSLLEVQLAISKYHRQLSGTVEACDICLLYVKLIQRGGQRDSYVMSKV